MVPVFVHKLNKSSEIIAEFIEVKNTPQCNPGASARLQIRHKQNEPPAQ